MTITYNKNVFSNHVYHKQLININNTQSMNFLYLTQIHKNKLNISNERMNVNHSSFLFKSVKNSTY